MDTGLIVKVVDRVGNALIKDMGIFSEPPRAECGQPLGQEPGYAQIRFLSSRMAAQSR